FFRSLVCVSRKLLRRAPRRQRLGTEELAVNAHEHHPTGGAERGRAVAQHVEVEGHGLGADTADVGRYAEPVVEAGRRVELAMDGLAGEEDIVAVEYAGVRQAARAEQLRLGDLEEADVGTVKD